MRILAFDIGGTAIKIGVINESGIILEQKEMPTLAQKGGQDIMNRIIKTISEYKNIDRIGISTAGQIDVENGKVIFATDNLPRWTGMEIKKRIEERFSLPTAVENDVNAAALGEAYYGAGKGISSFLCLTYGTGIGGAIVEKGEIYHGAFGSAGEFGHIITHADGHKCTCGGKGCYEVYASTSALVREVKSISHIDDNINGKIIFDKVNNGNNEYKKIVDKWIGEINIGLASLIHIFNPPLIVLGGGIMKQQYIINSINERIGNCVMPSFKKVVIKNASLGNNAGILGASILSMRLE